MSCSSKTVALCVTGSIAAFKAVEMARLLIQQRVRVLPVLTRSGTKFLGPITLTGICGQPARLDMWDESFAGELHVHLASEADVVLVAPATADVLARMAQGRADDLVTALVLCARGPVIVAPAMHPRMWAHPATQQNVELLRQQGRVTLVGPVVGPVANNEVGMGRMAEPADIVAAVMAQLGCSAPQASQDLAGRHVIVTAGPTVEDLDPVRFLSNRSSGRMGFALAQRAAARGAQVTLISGPVELTTPAGVTRVDVRSALEMREALHRVLGQDLQGADVVVMAAAVGDYRPAEQAPSKIKRSGEAMMLRLEPNPDIIAELGQARTGNRPMLVGFAVESASGKALAALARGKLERKGLDMVVGNAADQAFGADTNRATIVTLQAADELALMSKDALADVIWDRVRDRLQDQP